MDTTDLDDDLALITAPLWKNLIFLKSGRSLFGFHTFASRDAAAAAIPPSLAILRRYVAIHPNFSVIDRAGRHQYFCREVSHAIPVPVSGSGDIS